MEYGFGENPDPDDMHKSGPVPKVDLEKQLEEAHRQIGIRNELYKSLETRYLDAEINLGDANKKIETRNKATTALGIVSAILFICLISTNNVARDNEAKIAKLTQSSEPTSQNLNIGFQDGQDPPKKERDDFLPSEEESKNKWHRFLWLEREGKDCYEIIWASENPGTPPKSAYVSREFFNKNYWLSSRGLPGSWLYSKYDVATGYVLRGKVTAKYSKATDGLNMYVVDMKLESGRDWRMFVRKDVFEKAEIGKGLMPKEIEKPTDVMDLNDFKGWLVSLTTARQDLYYFVPLDTTKKPILVKASPLMGGSYKGPGEAPEIKSDFGPCPSGKVTGKIDFDDYWYFVDVETEDGVKRYRTDKSFYNLVKVDDVLPLGSEKKEEKKEY